MYIYWHSGGNERKKRFLLVCIIVHVRVVIYSSKYSYNDEDNHDKNTSLVGGRRKTVIVERGERFNRFSLLIRETFAYLDCCRCEKYTFDDGDPDGTIPIEE